MARIQILELPVQVNGDDVETPFALIIDQVTDDDRSIDLGVVFDARSIELLKDATGARGVIVYDGTLDIG